MKESSVITAWESTSSIPWDNLGKNEAVAFTLSFVTQMSASLIEVARMPNVEHVADQHNATVKMLKTKTGPSYESEHDELIRLRKEIQEISQ